MKKISFSIFAFVAVTALSSCSSLEQLDKERLNHPSMDLTQYQKKKVISPLTQLGGVDAGSASAGCSVCAH